MKKGLPTMTLLITVITVVVAVMIIFGLWDRFQGSAGKTSSGFVYTMIDSVFGGA